MSKIHDLRQFVNERLTAAAEEICGVFEKTIIEYEEEIDRQRRLLDIIWKPNIKLQRIDVQQKHARIEQEGNSSLEQDEPEPLQVKEEPEPLQLKEERCSIQEGEQLEVKQEIEDFTLILPGEGNYIIKDDKGATSCDSVSDGNAEMMQRLDKSNNHKNNVLSSTMLKMNARVNVVNDDTRNTEKSLKCVTGEKRTCQTSAMEAGITPAAKTPYYCITCGKYFKTSKGLVVHIRTHTGEKPYPCNTCEKRFAHASALRGHVRIHTGEKPYPCKSCGRNFRSSTELKNHTRTHTGDKPYICITCGKRFSKGSNLLSHSRTHTGDKPHLCNTCGKSFSVRSTLRGHMRTHTGEKPYPCSTCGKRFSVRSTLRGHIKTHTGERPHACKTCGKGFYKGSALMVHMRTHTGEKPYPCNTCGKRFSVRSTLIGHMRTHTGERPYACKTCGKKFCKGSSLRDHMIIHTGEKPYLCGTCGKTFTRMTHLRRHKSMHKGEKPDIMSNSNMFTWRRRGTPFCNKKTQNFYRTNPELKAHLRVHTSGKPYLCNTCDRRFRNLSALKNHLRTHTEFQQYYVGMEEDVLSEPQLCNHERNSSSDQEPIQLKEEPEPLQMKEEPEPFQMKEELLFSTMSSAQYLRRFVNERLTAAAEEIFEVFERTIVEYEEEIDRQRRLLDIVFKPGISLHRIELPQQLDLKEEEEEEEEDVADQQLSNKEKLSILDQEDPDPKRVKVEQEELYTCLEAEQLALKQEELLVSYPTCEGSDHSEVWSLGLNCDQSEAEKDSPDNNSLERRRCESGSESCGTCEPSGDRQLLFDTSYLANNQHYNSGNHGNTAKMEKKYNSTSTSTINIKSNMKKEENVQDYNACSLENTLETSNFQPKHHNKPFKCNNCSKDFNLYKQLEAHLRTHTGEKPFSCTVCGKGFRLKRYLAQHMITHSAEKPFTCSRCRKTFRRSQSLRIHLRSHTGEKPYSCKICGKRFCRTSVLKVHTRIHTGEKPYPCNNCTKGFSDPSVLHRHIMKVHPGEKP
ncbi:uncharacterized protein ACBR49_020564 [Aulostomus maculatus]